MIDATNDHYIICGFGRVGPPGRARPARRGRALRGHRRTTREPRARRRRRRALHRGRGRRRRGPARAPGSMRARAVIACVDSDAENIFITLTARELRPDIAIVARAASEDSERKLLRAGADRVISPYKTSGSEMARLALHPQVSGVVDVAPEYRWRRSRSPPGCEGEGQTIGDVRGGAIIVGVRARRRHVPAPAARRDRARAPATSSWRMGTAAHAASASRRCSTPAPRGAARRDARRATCAPPSRRRPPRWPTAAAARSRADARAPQAGRPRRLRDQRRDAARARCSRRRRARSPSGSAARCASSSATRSTRVEVAGPGLPEPRSSPTPGTSARSTGCSRRATASAAAAREPARASTSSSSRPTRPAR